MFITANAFCVLLMQMAIFIMLFFISCSSVSVHEGSFYSIPLRQQLKFMFRKFSNVDRNFDFLLCFQLLNFLFLLLTHMCSSFFNKLSVFKYTNYGTNLCLNKSRLRNSSLDDEYWNTLFVLGFCISEAPFETSLFGLICLGDISSIPHNTFLRCNRLSSLASLVQSMYMFSIAVSPAENFSCLLVTHIQCSKLIKVTPAWVQLLLILLSYDVHPNPGPKYGEIFFTFMN